MAIDPSKIAKAIRAAQAAKKSIAKVPAKDARKVASQMNQRVGGTKPLSRPRGSGNIATRPVNVPKKTTVKSIPKRSPAQTSKERAISKSLQRDSFWTGMKTPPRVKPRPTNVLHNRPITQRQNQMNEFGLKRMGRERRIIEKTYKGIRKGRVQESTPKRSIFEREMNIPAGSGSAVRRKLSTNQLRQEVRAEKLGKSEWQKQIRDSVLNPSSTTVKGSKIDKLGNRRIVHPAKAEKSWESDRNAANAVREAERLTAKNKTRKYSTGGGRPARKSKGN
jgi:hypothetical protein